MIKDKSRLRSTVRTRALVVTVSLITSFHLSFYGSGADAQDQKSTEAFDQVREQARSLISLTAADARDIDDPVARVRVLTEAADLMWTLDSYTGRDLFQQAGEYALALDDEIDRTAKNEAVTDLTAQLKRRDQKLFDWFVSKLEEQAKNSKQAKLRQENRDIGGAASARSRVLLNLVREKFQTGKFSEAAELLAESFVDGVNYTHGFYLRLLAEKDTALAMSAFEKGLERVRALPNHELIEVLTMASFLFDMRGVSAANRTKVYFARPSLAKPDPNLVRKFLSFAREVIFENAALVQGGPVVQTREDNAATRRPQIVYLAIEQFLPLFETHWPEMAPELHQERAGMLAELQAQNVAPAKLPDFDSPSWQAAPEISADDQVDKELERARKAPTRVERDDWYFSATIHALWKEDISRAESAAKAISDSDRARKAQAFVSLVQMRQSWKGGDISSAEQTIESIEYPDLKLQALVWLADQFKARGDFARVAELLSSALSIAAKTEAGLQRSQAFLMISQSAMKAYPILGTEALLSAISALKGAESPSVKDVRSKDGEFSMPRATRFGPSGMIKDAKVNGIKFDLFALLSEFATRDFYGALALIAEIKSLEIKLLGRLAVARSQINQAGNPDRNKPGKS